MPYFEHRTHRAFDGTAIAYRVGGPSDGPVLLLCDGIGCDGFAWKYLIQDFGERCRIVHPHYRGHGASQVPEDLERLSVPDICRDLEGLLEQESISSCVTLGHSMGVQVCLELARRDPGLVRAIGLLCGSFGRPLDTFHDTAILRLLLPYLLWFFEHGGPRAVKLWAAIGRNPANWHVARIAEVHRELARREDFVPYLEHLSKMNPLVFFKMLRQASGHTAMHYLRDLHIPATVVAGEKDGFTPMWLSRKMARHLPDSDLVVVPQGSHIAPLERPDLVKGAVGRLLDRAAAAEHEPQRSSSSSSS